MFHKKFAKFTGKRLRRDLFLNKAAGVRPENLTQLFFLEFYKIFKSTFFTEHLLWLLLTLVGLLWQYFYSCFIESSWSSRWANICSNSILSFDVFSGVFTLSRIYDRVLCKNSYLFLLICFHKKLYHRCLTGS